MPATFRSSPFAPFALVFWLFAALALSAGGCRSGSSGATSVGGAETGASAVPPAWSGKTYFTQHGLRHEKDRYRTTNYQVGILIPVNSEVEVRAMDERSATLFVRPTGKELRVENVEKHTGLSMADAFAVSFGEQPVDLSRFTADEQRFIAEGRAEPGMRKEAVLAAIGRPPAVGTASLDSNEWKYWRTRFTTFVLRFQDGVLVEQIGR